MDLLKTPSVQSLLDSDLESVGSLQYLDIEELDEIEYALPASEAPTLEEVLSTEDEENRSDNEIKKPHEEPATCSALQVDFLQAVSQQVKQAQERSSAGAATALGVGSEGKVTVGMAHGQLLSFYDQTLRWVCNSNVDTCGAVSCISYNKDSTRLLAGYARGLICQYESIQGAILRRVTLGGEIWGILRVTWAGASGLALDTGGSVWLMKFSRPLGVRTARSSCLFSGARGEVVTMTARDARVLALATLSRVIIVAGGRAAGLRLNGPPDTLPVLEWSETDDRVLICARANLLQWLSLSISGASISLRPLKRVELKSSPLWLGWLGGNLAIFDADENLRLWGEDYDKPLELSHIEPVYASAFYKGHWTDGRVSRAMCRAGASALAGACVADGALCVLGRRGVLRVRPRDALARAQAFFSSGRHAPALRLACAAEGPDAKAVAEQFVYDLSERPHLLSNKTVADLAVKLCVRHQLGEELWTTLWEQCSGEQAFVEALGDAVVRGELSTSIPPSPDSTQALIERLGTFEPSLVERVVASLPLASLDPHRASVFTRERGLWRGVGAIAAAIGGWSHALATLSEATGACGAARGECTCAGAALVLAAADALAGRGAGGRALPPHRRPSARHDALQALLSPQDACGGRSPLRVIVEHEAAAGVRLLEQCARDPPFAGPLAKQNRLRVARHLLAFAPALPEVEDRADVLDFLAGQLTAGALPADRDTLDELLALAATADCERGDRAWLALVARARLHPDRLEAQHAAAAARPRVRWRLDAERARTEPALAAFFDIAEPSEADVDEVFEYLRARLVAGDEAQPAVRARLPALLRLRPRAAAALVADHFPDAAAGALAAAPDSTALDFGEKLREAGQLRGEAAAAHLRVLCRLRPAAVRRFLADEPGAVRPEEALAIVRETGPPDAEPACLEAGGDAPAALEALLRLAAGAADEADAARWTAEAGELCARAAPAMPPAAAAALWSRLLGAARDAPPALLLAALAYLPAEETLRHACRSRDVALAMLSCAARDRGLWECCVRGARREAHEALARALAGARRGVAVRGRCARCGARLAGRGAARTAHCARAFHADCEAEACCGWCGRRAPDSLVSLAPRAVAAAGLSVADDLSLLLVAPPRPDLEGVV